MGEFKIYWYIRKKTEKEQKLKKEDKRCIV